MPRELTRPVPDMSLLGRARRGVRRVVGRYPALYLLWVRPLDMAVTSDTQIVIEGFPRSGNSFAVAAFRLAQPGELRIAHHLHVPAQVITAVRRGIPALLLIRPAEDAVVSLVVRRPEMPLRDVFRDYVAFYRPLLAYADGVVVADFSEVITDFGAVIRKLNARFGTGFAEFEHSPENVGRCFRILEEQHRTVSPEGRDFEAGVARPSPDRDRLKDAVRRQLEHRDLSRITRDARELYERFLHLA